MRFHRPDVVGSEIVTKIQRTALIRSYLPLANTDRLPDLEETLNGFLGRDTIVMWDLNTDVGQMENPRNQQKDDFLESFWMVDLLGHLSKRLRFQLKQTWWQFHKGK